MWQNIHENCLLGVRGTMGVIVKGNNARKNFSHGQAIIILLIEHCDEDMNMLTIVLHYIKFKLSLRPVRVVLCYSWKKNSKAFLSQNCGHDRLDYHISMYSG